jgi:protocatechuate 3,4-dioxygenase beta subunit
MKMGPHAPRDPGRRAIVTGLLALPAAHLLHSRFARAEALPLLEPTPECADDGPTPPQTAGPFFKPDSPLRGSLVEPGLAGTPLVVAGTVLTTECTSVANALLDFWHTDDTGRYDLAGYRFRGHQLTDGQGRYRLETIVPGAYSGRTRHIHVRVQAPGGRLLTTQLYFPGEARNEADGIFSSRLLMHVAPAESGREARFDFVLGA